MCDITGLYLDKLSLPPVGQRIFTQTVRPRGSSFARIAPMTFRMRKFLMISVGILRSMERIAEKMLAPNAVSSNAKLDA